MSLVGKYTMRSLARSRRRTLLSVLGVGLGCAIAVFSTAFMRGGREMRIRAISESGYGHVRIAPEGWAKSRRDELRLQDGAAAQAAARGLAGVKVVAGHARAQGLLAFGTRVAGVQILGVDPAVEPQLNRLVRTNLISRVCSGTVGSTIYFASISKCTCNPLTLTNQ